MKKQQSTQNILRLERKHFCGFFSCCSVGVFDIINYIKEHKTVPEVDFSRIFSVYKKDPNENVHDMTFNVDKSQFIDIDKILNLNYSRLSLFDYRDENINDVQQIVKRWFTPNDIVRNHIDSFIEKYEIDFEKTLAVCFRGTDKYLEIKEAKYEDFASNVRNIMEKQNLDRVLIQTDQQQFLDFFEKNYSDIPFFNIKEIPTSIKKGFIYRDTIKNDKIYHAQMFLAALKIVSGCKFLINHTGNVARWIVKYRGSTNNMIQYKAGLNIS